MYPHLHTRYGANMFYFKILHPKIHTNETLTKSFLHGELWELLMNLRIPSRKPQLLCHVSGMLEPSHKVVDVTADCCNSIGETLSRHGINISGREKSTIPTGIFRVPGTSPMYTFGRVNFPFFSFQVVWYHMGKVASSGLSGNRSTMSYNWTTRYLIH